MTTEEIFKKQGEKLKRKIKEEMRRVRDKTKRSNIKGERNFSRDCLNERREKYFLIQTLEGPVD
jgi:hypothetical protein